MNGLPTLRSSPPTSGDSVPLGRRALDRASFGQHGRATLLTAVSIGVAGAVLVLAASLVRAKRGERFEGRSVTAWTRALQSEDAETRRQAAGAFVRAAPHSPAVTHALLAVLDAGDRDELHGTVADAIVQLGPVAQAASGQFVALLRDEHPGIRAQAALILGQVGSTTGDHLAPVAAALTDADARVRRAAARSVGLGGTHAERYRRELVVAAGDSNAAVRLEAVRSLMVTAPETTLVLPVLVAALSDSSEQVRLAAAYAVARYGEYAGTAVPALGRALKDGHFGMRVAAAVALGRIGPGAATAVPQLRLALSDPDGGTREAAAAALARISR